MSPCLRSRACSSGDHALPAPPSGALDEDRRIPGDGAGAGNPLRIPGASPLGRDPGPGTSPLRAAAVSRGCSRCFDRVHLAGHRWRRARGHRTRRGPGRQAPAWPLLPARGAGRGSRPSVASRARPPGTFHLCGSSCGDSHALAGGAGPVPLRGASPGPSAAASPGGERRRSRHLLVMAGAGRPRASPHRVSAQITVRARV
jgi:hypothetical protein